MNWFGAAVGEEETQPEATGEEAGHPLRLPRLRPRSDAELLNGVVTELLSAATAAAKTARRPSGGTKSHRMPRPWTFGLHMNEPHPVLCVVPSHIVSRHHVLRSYPPPTRDVSVRPPLPASSRGRSACLPPCQLQFFAPSVARPAGWRRAVSSGDDTATVRNLKLIWLLSLH